MSMNFLKVQKSFFQGDAKSLKKLKTKKFKFNFLETLKNLGKFTNFTISSNSHSKNFFSHFIK